MLEKLEHHNVVEKQAMNLNMRSVGLSTDVEAVY